MSDQAKTLTDLREAVFVSCICGGTTLDVTATGNCPACMVWLRFMEPQKAEKQAKTIETERVEWRLIGSKS